MRIGKKARQKLILDIINNNEISTQEELVNKLKDEGLVVTQATISRDIKDLNIVKANTSEGRQKFVAMKAVNDPDIDKLLRVYSEAVIDADVVGNLIIMQTLPGMASACASAIDSMDLSQIAGTIAGDDTIFIAAYASTDMNKLKLYLMQFALD